MHLCQKRFVKMLEVSRNDDDSPIRLAEQKYPKDFSIKAVMADKALERKDAQEFFSYAKDSLAIIDHLLFTEPEDLYRGALNFSAIQTDLRSKLIKLLIDNKYHEEARPYAEPFCLSLYQPDLMILEEQELRDLCTSRD